ncbi:MAG: diguanylate cyclase [Planctomycetes bacterium]|nr:diguanylate cyclase [Planctomycetota bacterium]
MSTPTASTRTTNPLGSLPSVLAIRDLRRRLGRELRGRAVTQDEVVRILQLDPLAVVRGLRAASAPIFGAPSTGWTVRSMANRLGPALSRRLLRTPTLGVAGTTRLRRLWLHAIATALAAQELAVQTGLVDPEHAYLLGLLHDLPQWLDVVAEQGTQTDVTVTPQQWIAHWQLPADLVELFDARRAPPGSPLVERPADATALVFAAELLAELADFGHPDDDLGPDAASAVLAAADKRDLVAAQKLRRQVESTLRAFGLDPTLPDADPGEDHEPSLHAGRQHGELHDVVLSVLGCTRSESYRGIVTALTAAGVRYGGYDRALFVRWDQASARVLVRSKADSSARRLATTLLTPTPAEAATLRQAMLEERPTRITAEFGQHAGVLAALSTDELLAVPLNRAFATPAFLLLDRSLSAAPIQPERDIAMALTLGMTGSLLIENLLLRRRRQRAQKFALTDALTRLFNRRMGLVTLDQELSRASRSEHPMTVLMCDLDHFKQLNDSHGHLQGDMALRATAEVLRQTLRRSDTICRLGGEEFLVVLPDTTADEATVLATRLFTAVQRRGEELGLPVTISIGLTDYRTGDSVESILQRADHALYASKDYGRNRFSVDVEGTDEVPLVTH